MPFDLQEQQATLKRYLRDIVDGTFRDRPFWFKLMNAGKIKFKVTGESQEWRVRMDILQGRGYDDTMTPQFQQAVRYRTASTNWRGYQLGESLRRQQMERNAGPEAIVNLVKDAQERIGEDLKLSIQDDIYIDGAAAGNTLKWEGFETFLTAHASNTGASGKTRDPDGTYAGLITDPGNYGGSWTGDWPAGTSRTPSYDFWSPLLVDTTATAWGTGPSFSVYGLDQLAFGIGYAARQPIAMPVKMLDLVLMTLDDYLAFEKLYRGTERIVVDSTPQGKAVGFKLMSFNGVDVTHDFGVPASTIYGMMMSHVEYNSVVSDIFTVDKPQMLQDGSGMIFNAWVHGNFKYFPRGFVKWYPYTS